MQSMRKIALIGHSHAVCILDAMADWRQSLALNSAPVAENYSEAFRGWFTVNTGGRMFALNPYPEFEAFAGTQICVLNMATFSGMLAQVSRVVDGRVHFEMSKFLTSFIQQVAGADAIISVIYGHDHSRFGVVANMPEYDFEPFESPPAGQPIDRMYIDRVLHEMCMTVAAPLACLRGAMPTAKIVHVMPPPPLFDPSNASVQELYAPLVKEHGLVRPSLRRKWHSAYVDRVKAQLAPFRVNFVEADHEIVCEDGFLKPEFAEGISHGNREYGRVMARRIADAIAQPV